MYVLYAEYRDERGLTDNAVAKAVGITASTIYDWKQRSAKNPTARLSVDHLKKIADYLGITVDDLITEKEE